MDICSAACIYTFPCQFPVFERIIEESLPPKPKALLRICLISEGGHMSVTGTIPLSIGVCQLMFGGKNWF